MHGPERNKIDSYFSLYSLTTLTLMDAINLKTFFVLNLVAPLYKIIASTIKTKLSSLMG